MPKKNELYRYLEENELTQREFAKRLSKVRGWPVYQSQVNKWARGVHRPGREIQGFIARATKGAVPVESW